VVVGIRPEDFKPAATPAKVQARLDVVEPVGNEAFLNLDYHGTPLVVRTSPSALPEPGQWTNLDFMPARLHFFDAQTQQRIGA
jgi:multiple sugar transport system ATP-binding protein